MWTSWFGAHSSGALASPIRFLFVRTRLCSTLPSDPLSRGRPCASLALRLHQAVQRTCTSKLSNMLGTPLALPRGPSPRAGRGTRRSINCTHDWCSSAFRSPRPIWGELSYYFATKLQCCVLSAGCAAASPVEESAPTVAWRPHPRAIARSLSPNRARDSHSFPSPSHGRGAGVRAARRHAAHERHAMESS